MADKVAKARERSVSHLVAKKHHEKSSSCYSRPKYRNSRWDKAVKVYTINLESKFILVNGVPSIEVTTELVTILTEYGKIEKFQKLTADEYPTEEFTEVYMVKYEKINNARYAKRKVDSKSFFGSVLHVCYAPEFESVGETREKLEERRRVIARKTRGGDMSGMSDKHSHQQTIASPVPTASSSTTLGLSWSASLPSSGDPSNLTASHTVNQTNENANAFDNQIKCSEYPQLPPPPLHLRQSLRPQPSLPWELPRVPSAHSTLPLHLQDMSYITPHPGTFQSKISEHLYGQNAGALFSSTQADRFPCPVSTQTFGPYENQHEELEISETNRQPRHPCHSQRRVGPGSETRLTATKSSYEENQVPAKRQRKRI